MSSTDVNSPSEKFERIIKFVRCLASICGIDLLKPSYRMNWVTYTLFFFVACYYSFVFYTIWRNYQDDWTIFLRASVTLGSSFQGVSKLITFISRKDDMMHLYNVLSGIYKEYGRMSDKYVEALHANERERFLVIDFHVPGVDIRTDWGYFCTMAFQTVLVICFSFSLYCGDVVALVYLLQSFMFSYIFAAKIEYVNEMLTDPRTCRLPSVTAALKDIAKWHQQFSGFTNTCNNLFYYVITVQIMTAFCSTVLSIYLIVTGAWPGAYTYVVVAICSLYVYCILGTETERANQKFEYDIYNLHLCNMTVAQQRIVLQILHKTQNPQTIDVAEAMPLSVSTALDITKVVYWITMFMIQFLHFDQ